MPDITVSSTVDAFMAATTPAEARDAIGAGAKLLCLVDHDDPGSFYLLPSIVTVYAWPVVTQEAPIYNVTTGEFTVPETGVYCVNVALNLKVHEATVFDYASVGITVNDGTGRVVTCPVCYPDGQIQAAGSLILPLNEGDVFTVNSYISCGPDGLVLDSYYNQYWNKIRLFKL